MRVSQYQLDKLVPELNQVVKLHNDSMVPKAHLREFPSQRRVIVVEERKKFKGELARPEEHAIAYCNHASDKIAIESSTFEEAAEKMDYILGLEQYQDMIIVRDKVKIALLNVLMHENVHRSCERRAQPTEIRDAYLDTAMRCYYDCPESIDAFESVKTHNGKLWVQGLNYTFEMPEGFVESKYGGDTLDEFVTHWLSSHAIGRYLAKIGYTKDPLKTIPILQMLIVDQETIDTYIRSNDMMHHFILNNPQGYQEFVRDYLQADIPRRLCHAESPPGYPSIPAIHAIAGHLTDSLEEGLPGLIGVYWK